MCVCVHHIQLFIIFENRIIIFHIHCHQPSTTAAVAEAAIIVIIFLSRRWRRRRQTTDNINPKHLFLRVAKRVAVAVAAHLTDWALAAAAAWLAGYTVFLLLKLTYFRQFFLLSISHTHTHKYTHGVEEIPVDPSSYLILNLVKLHRKIIDFCHFCIGKCIFSKVSFVLSHTQSTYISALRIYIHIYTKKGS